MPGKSRSPDYQKQKSSRNTTVGNADYLSAFFTRTVNHFSKKRKPWETNLISPQHFSSESHLAAGFN